MAKPVKPAKKKKSGNLLVHVVILLLLATVGWRLHALQGQVRAAQAERDQYARQVENVQQENETLRSDIAEGPTEEKMKELAREELGMIDSNSYLFSQFRKCTCHVAPTLQFRSFSVFKSSSHVLLYLVWFENQ